LGKLDNRDVYECRSKPVVRSLIWPLYTQKDVMKLTVEYWWLPHS